MCKTFAEMIGSIQNAVLIEVFVPPDTAGRPLSRQRRMPFLHLFACGPVNNQPPQPPQRQRCFRLRIEFLHSHEIQTILHALNACLPAI